MSARIWIAASLLTSFGALAVSAAPRTAAPRRKPVTKQKTVATPKPLGKKADPAAPARKMTLEEARTAVAMLGDAYDLILDEAHSIYHTRPNTPVAATVVRKVQARMTELGWPQSRFVAVNAIVMHPNHVPRDDFERRTVQTFKHSGTRLEEVTPTQLRVATMVPLGGGCASCHWTGSGQSPRAATTWKVPLKPAAGDDR